MKTIDEELDRIAGEVITAETRLLHLKAEIATGLSIPDDQARRLVACFRRQWPGIFRLNSDVSHD